jgi:2-keto-4-pentenoate hydratase/2-oxohepta-3-ene-1,7-dioic acid hydratase in catechol pathway
MKFATYVYEGKQCVGAVDERAGFVRRIDLSTMLELIESDSRAAVDSSGVGEDIPLRDVQLLAPIPSPRRNIFCVGKNYRDHAKEFSRSGFEAGARPDDVIDDYPAVFTKPATSVIGTGAHVPLHPGVTAAVDYEGELAVVIGKGGINIPRESAWRHVWGYTIINDVTARDRQKNHRQWFLGKGLDGFCPMGPWITTADEIDPSDLRIRTWVNGELRQDATLTELIFDIPTLIASISAGMTLMPGDIIATGTPSGVGIGMHPPRFLSSGDVVAIEVDGIGRLENAFGTP